MPDQITRLLDQIDLLDRTATTGPWILETDTHRDLIKSPADDQINLVATVVSPIMDSQLIALSRTAMPALGRLVRRLLEDHHMVTTSWGEEQCATCIIDAGATGADRMEWPCDIYTTITDALGEDE